ncbi:NADPH-dependent FMN reductase [Chachezhania antarctica]|uniref:NADPH-dependent FMN reductase n=1 Tax=Chachezhania antarctica TaxID=2340860 RepID=UPI000EB333CC|nr:NADPH-dependent FMN reductase [Chachezhania antarctica]|tara:strand:+ start:2894 stop:3436 length:543 start_codon:yes stop_codon:yes gene_type:complete
MTDTPRLVGLSGALRSGSTNRKLVHEAARLFGPADFEELDLNLPLYDGDDEARDGVPAAVVTLAEKIKSAEAVIISTPEYNKGISGVLKNALDWISRTDIAPWADKPVAVMSAAAGRAGGERGQAMLRQCLVAFQPRLITGPEVHLAGSSKEFDDDGRLTGEIYIKTLTRLMEKLRAEVG